MDRIVVTPKEAECSRRRHWSLSACILVLLLLGVSVFLYGRPTRTRTDVSFEWLVKPVYTYAWPFQDGIAWVETGLEYSNLWTLLDQNGTIVKKEISAIRIFPYTEEKARIDYALKKNTSDSLINVYLRDIRSAFLDRAGEQVTSEYDAVGCFSSGLAAVRKNDKYGFIDTEGKIAIPFQYDWAGGFVGNLGGVGKDGKYGFINKKGETVVDFVFDIPSLDVLPYYPQHNLQAVRTGRMRGLLNDRREWVAEPKYERLYCGEDPLVGLQKDGKVGFVNLSGDVVIDFQFLGIPVENNNDSDYLGAGSLPYCYRFSEGRAIILMPPKWGSPDWHSGYGVINTEGKLLFTFKATPYGLYSEGYLAVQNLREKKAGLFDLEGNWIPLPDEICFRFPGVTSELKGGILNVTTSKTKHIGDYRTDDFKAGYLKVIKKDGKR